MSVLVTLRLGSRDKDAVSAWQLFLLGQGLNVGKVDGDFGQLTLAATKVFQKTAGLTADGVVGRMTYAHALQLGFGAVTGEPDDDLGPAWPQRPQDLEPMSYIDRAREFGSFAFVPAPTPNNPEGIRITDGWARKNITCVEIPQLKNIKGAPADGKITLHWRAVDQFVAMFAAWESAGLTDKILTFGGSWVPRFVRGSRTSLSNHSLGTAIDINVQWNMLGHQPALKGEKGSVRELVSIAAQNGIYWGGWGWSGSGSGSGSENLRRWDGMHFEIARVI